MILNATRTVVQMEDEGREIGQHLEYNRKKLEDVREKNNQFGSTMDTSETILKRMNNRAEREKCIIS